MKKKTGAYPYIMTPLTNGQTLILYFMVTLTDGTTRRARLVPPTTEEENMPAVIALETKCDILGCTTPQTGTVLTNMAGIGAGINTNMPVVFSVFNPALDGGTFFLGCSTNTSTGELLLGTTSCLGSAPADSWFTLQAVAAPDQVYLKTGQVMTAVSLGALGAQRALRALPTLTPGVYTLAWKAPASPDGLDVAVLPVSTGCGPCASSDDPVAPPNICLDS